MKTSTGLRNCLPASRGWISSSVLLGLLLISTSPTDAQGGDHGAATGAGIEAAIGITGSSAQVDDLVLTVAWPASVAETWHEIAVFDEGHVQIAGQLVWPAPGQHTETTFADVLQSWPASGPQFFAVVRDTAGREVSQGHAFRGILDCPPSLEPCRWATRDGLYTNALSLTEPLRAALDGLETKRSNDLLGDVLEQQPDLRGAVFSLASQLDRLDQRLDLGGDCLCAWYHSVAHQPSQRVCRSRDYAQLDSFGELVEIEDLSATAWVGAQVRGDLPAPLQPRAASSTRHTMELRCWKIYRWIEQVTVPLFPSPGRPPQTIRWPVAEACAATCRGSVESSASLSYHLETAARQSAPEQAFALAAVKGTLERDAGTHPPEVESRHAELQWTPGDPLTTHGDRHRLPAEDSFVDDNVRRLTISLSGEAEGMAYAAAADAWSYSKAFVHGTLLQAKGHADCALLPAREAQVDTLGGVVETEDCGEPLIEPWEDF